MSLAVVVCGVFEVELSQSVETDDVEMEELLEIWKLISKLT